MDDGLARLREIVESVLDAPVDERDVILADACAGDAALRADAESLLRHADAARGFLEGTVLGPEFAVSPGIAPDQVVGRAVGPYRLTGVIASGGMGTVYRAERGDDEYRKQVAIKFVRSGLLGARAAERFRTERQLLADIEHPYVARLLDGGTTEEGWPYFVMEYIDGAPLDQFCDERRLPIPARLELFQKVCSAVDFAHRNLVVHCDLKPGNILVTGDGTPRLLDFGIARLLAVSVEEGPGVAGTQTPLGMTPPYSSPEIIAGKPVATSADIYSLGVILCELLCGRRPVDLAGDERASGVLRPSDSVALSPPGGAPTVESISAARGTSPRALRRSLRGDLDSIVLRAISPDPRRRYASVAQLVEDIARSVQRRPVSARRQTLGYRTGCLVRRRAGAVSLAAALALTLVIGTAVSSSGFVREAAARQRADAEAAKAARISAFLGETLAWSDPFLGLRGDPSLGDLLDHAVARIDRGAGDDPEVEAILRSTIGVAYQNFGNLAAAEPQLRAALRLRQEEYGDVHIEVAESHHRLGRMLQIKGDRAEAERQFQGALEIRRELLGAEHRLVADVLHDLARHLRRTEGREEEMHRVLLEALQIRRRVLEPGDPDLADSLESLGNAHVRQDDFADGERLLLEALSIRREALPDGDPKIMRTYHNLAHLKERAGDLDEAEAYLLKSIDMGRRVYGDDDPSLINPLMSLAEVARATERSDIAEDLLREAVAIGAASLPPNHYMALLCRQRYGQLLAVAGGVRGHPRDARGGASPGAVAVGAAGASLRAHGPDGRRRAVPRRAHRADALNRMLPGLARHHVPTAAGTHAVSRASSSSTSSALITSGNRNRIDVEPLGSASTHLS